MWEIDWKTYSEHQSEWFWSCAGGESQAATKQNQQSRISCLSTIVAFLWCVDKLLNDTHTIERFLILLNDYPVFDRAIVQEYLFYSKQPSKRHRKNLLKSYSWTFPKPQTLYPQSFWAKEKNPNFVSKLEFFYGNSGQYWYDTVSDATDISDGCIIA